MDGQVLILSTDSLTKEDCDAQLNAYIDDGIAPNRLRAVPSQHS